MDSKANVLIDKDGHARLTDFGLATVVRGDNSHLGPQDHNLTDTTTWAAPEILGGGPVSKEGDIFMFAIVVIEVRTWEFTGRGFDSPAFAQTFMGYSPSDDNYQTPLYDTVAGERPNRPEALRHDELWETIGECWNQEPGKRPTTSKLLEFFRTS